MWLFGHFLEEVHMRRHLPAQYISLACLYCMACHQLPKHYTCHVYSYILCLACLPEDDTCTTYMNGHPGNNVNGS